MRVPFSSMRDIARLLKREFKMSDKLVGVHVKHLVISSAQQGSNNDDNRNNNVDVDSIGDVNLKLDALEEKVYQWQAISHVKSTINQEEFTNVINTLKTIKNFLKKEENSLLKARIGTLTLEVEAMKYEQNKLQEKHNKLQEKHNELQGKSDKLQGKHNKLQEKHNKLQEKSDKRESLLVLGDLLKMYRFYYVDADLIAVNKQWRVAVNEFSTKAAELKDGDITESQFQAWSTQFVNQCFPRLQNLKLEEIIHYGRQRNGEAHTELSSKVEQQAFLLKIENEFDFANKDFGNVARRLLTELKKVTLTKLTSF